MKNIFEFRNIGVTYKMKNYDIKAVDKVDFDIKKGKITALVGESGSGKTTLATAILNSITSPGEITCGDGIYYQNKDDLSSLFKNEASSDSDDYITHINKLNKIELNKYRWREVSMVFQGAQSSLNPIESIFHQFRETIKVHLGNEMSNKEITIFTKKRMKELLELVNLDCERVQKMYPHELSGGMKQRVMIAFSLLLNPKLVILDEPTTALDVITQDHIFSLLQKINRENGISMLLLTHDIGVVAKYTDYVGVLYAGKLVEYGTTREIFKESKHPYTIGLINATPSLQVDIESMKSIPGNPPDLMNLPQGCSFNPRCSEILGKCMKLEPEVNIDENNHLVKCHLFGKDVN